jgi:ribulose-phosphate 3-epimerase
LHRTLSLITETGKRVGVSIVPSTPVSAICEVLSIVDIVLVMTVNPGFGGQKMIPQTLRKVETLRALREEGKFRYQIEVDGGINPETAVAARKAGAEILVSGSAFFSSESPGAEVMRLKGYKVV